MDLGQNVLRPVSTGHGRADEEAMGGLPHKGELNTAIHNPPSSEMGLRAGQAIKIPRECMGSKDMKLGGSLCLLSRKTQSNKEAEQGPCSLRSCPAPHFCDSDS
ncbi:hypothetical protein H1C71_017127 [Ictidomys tridecemlineatus]|nr:hypothetical protein H1C71_017127 [Ictidomys tridecemlineatus]